jgi:hypothetical protein
MPEAWSSCIKRQSTKPSPSVQEVKPLKRSESQSTVAPEAISVNVTSGKLGIPVA